ncbi:hypothetical protein BOX15_Mlig034335g2 [Macrostomum lignano]|uniref:Protein sleepless n=1 Tax=Macrostomum lignano TaxID=282301 RepID=A0A267E9Z9_9PLAT|nr:hypothetical protein BOX15_Mlig034335g2 [Macrostomum lignano]
MSLCNLNPFIFFVVSLCILPTLCIGQALYADNSIAKNNETLFHCYICNSFLDHKCSDFFDNRTRLVEPCPSPAHRLCRKIIQETYYDGSWDRRYIRDCAIHGDIGAEEGRWCIERLGTLRVKMRFCHCNNKHGCNAAFAGPSVARLLVPLLLLLPSATKFFASLDSA